MIEKPGWRHNVYLLLGIGHIAQGLAILMEPVYPADYYVLYQILSPDLRVGLWVASGIIVGLAAARARWHPVAATVGVLMPMERAISYVYSFLAEVIPGIPGGYLSSGVLALRWAAFIGLILALSRWPMFTPPEEDTGGAR